MSLTERRETRKDTVKRELRDRVIINVGGKKFEPYVSTLRNIPDLPIASILENKTKLDYDPETGEYFFDRHPGVFQQLLNYLQTGNLHCPRNVCGPLFEQELAYWGLEERQMESCCWPSYTKHRDAQENLKMLNFRPKYDENEGGRRRQFYDNPNLSWWKRHQPIIWEILDEPYSSSTAKVFAWVSLAFIVTSIFTICLWTIELFKGTRQESRNVTTANTNLTSNGTAVNYSPTTMVTVGYQTPLDVITIIDAVCTGWFTLEFILRLTFCPDKLQFAKKIQNWMDFLVIIPLYLLLVLGRTMLIEYLNTLRVVRIFRFFKLLYDLQILGNTLTASRHQLCILLFILFIPVIVFSSLVLYAETTWGNKEEFHNLPNSLWWGIVTMTTLGYGDVVPTSFAGKVIGGVASICGIIILSTSASVIGSTFSLYYNLAQAQLRIPKKKRKFEVDIKSLPTVLACRTSQADSTVISNNSDSGYQRSPNRLKICDRNSFEFDPNATLSNRPPCACQFTQNSLPSPPPTKYPSSPRGPVTLTRKASIRRESILV